MTLTLQLKGYIVHWELVLSMRAQEIAEIIATALERVHGKSPRIVRDNGSQFVAKEVNKGKKKTRLVNGAPVLGRSERGAEAIDLTSTEEGCIILP